MPTGLIVSSSNDSKPPSLAAVGPAANGATLIDEPALATKLGVSRSTLQSWRYNGRGPRHIKLGRMVRYRTADVDEFLRSNTHGNVA
jgi:predicted DNA-binding transcriptional regulator AlpA